MPNEKRTESVSEHIAGKKVSDMPNEKRTEDVSEQIAGKKVSDMPNEKRTESVSEHIADEKVSDMPNEKRTEDVSEHIADEKVSDMPSEKRTESVSEHIAGKAGEVCSIVDGMLSELQNRERLGNAPLNQLSSALGTLVDKFARDNDEDGGGELSKIFKDFEDIV